MRRPPRRPCEPPRQRGPQCLIHLESVLPDIRGSSFFNCPWSVVRWLIAWGLCLSFAWHGLPARDLPHPARVGSPCHNQIKNSLSCRVVETIQLIHMNGNKGPAIVLSSGGLDSTTCLAIAKNQQFAPIYSLSFDYGQRHRRELE